MTGSRPRQVPMADPSSGPRESTIDFPVIGIGASAGGLEACAKFVEAAPAGFEAACVLVVHLDPTHESMMVELLGKHTSMAVLQATDGMPVERGKLYVIPPGRYLSVSNRTLRLSQPRERHGARLPFDFLLHSLAAEFGENAIGVVLSGTGSDGCEGLKDVKAKGGLVIAQDPGEAAFDGMPRGAIQSGAVDMVLPVARIPAAIVEYRGTRIRADAATPPAPAAPGDDWLTRVIEVLWKTTRHDFTAYKRGTLRRRIERRMAMGPGMTGNREAYLDLLRNDAGERDQLAKDLLIHVTSFFRDSGVFEFLREQGLPDLLRSRPEDHTFRAWIAGCSTGEEAYSIAIAFREAIAALNLNCKLQVFASDVDPEAVAQAREGLYPPSIAGDVSPARLARHFSKEDRGYRISTELRATVVFTLQDVLADPPFSRLDFVSCRNVLIYLLPDAQAKVISLFHFALREGGLLLLGNSESIGDAAGSFEVVSKTERLFRRIGGRRAVLEGYSMGRGEGPRVPARQEGNGAHARRETLASLCQRLIAEEFGPAAALVNLKHECLYFSGRTDDFLKVAPGAVINDILSMARDGVRAKLRLALQRAAAEQKKVSVTGGRMIRDGVDRPFGVMARPVSCDGESLLLVCFIDEKEASRAGKPAAPRTRRDLSRIAELEQEAEALRLELHEANLHLETVGQEQKAINEEAMSVNEEYQSTNEELTTSKEELQSLNEELTALNSQLQETLERQRTTSNDLQNVLYSTDVATLFLDKSLHIRFFTPATRLLFNVIPGDVGRPLADLSSLTADGQLVNDVGEVLKTLKPLEREIETRAGAWYTRRVSPYRAQDARVEGVVVTYIDVTERRHVADALEVARREAQVASLAKSRFLAAASHDLRQPLQTFVLLQGILAKSIEGEREKKLVSRLGEAASAMSGMLNALLDINQIEAGAVQPELSTFRIDDLFTRLKEEFTYHAQAKRLSLRVVPCTLFIHSDPGLFEQIVRNLLTNAMKYTKGGKILLGCRRRAGHVSVEVWDTGIGIPESEFKTIFEEYHQIDNAARERSRGLGLGLFIVQRLAKLLRYRISVRSRLGSGSGFAIEIALPVAPPPAILAPPRPETAKRGLSGVEEPGATILIVEDDPDVRELLELFLTESGYRATSAPDGVAALDLAARGLVKPDFILADYNLPNGMNGLEAISKLRAAFARDIPAIILTGDISTNALRAIAQDKCEQLNKPVNLAELTNAIRRRLQARPPATPAAPGTSTIFVVDDDSHVRSAIRAVLEADGQAVQDFGSAEDFLAVHAPDREGCLLVDAHLPGMSGLELVERLARTGSRLPSIMITGNGDVPMAVAAMKAGVVDFIEKPADRRKILASVERALEQSRDADKLAAWRKAAADHVADLTTRQREIMDMVLAGHPSKNIAADLGISQRTVENHRAAIMKRTGAKSLPALARLAVAAAWRETDGAPGEPEPGKPAPKAGA